MILSTIALILVIGYGTMMMCLHNKLRDITFFTYELISSFNEDVLENKAFSRYKFLIKHYFWMRKKFLGE